MHLSPTFDLVNILHYIRHPHSTHTEFHRLATHIQILELDWRKIVRPWKLVYLLRLPRLYPSSFPTSPPRSQRSNSPCESPRELYGLYELCHLHLLCFTSWHRSSSFWTSRRRYSCELHTARLCISWTRRSALRIRWRCVHYGRYPRACGACAESCHPRIAGSSAYRRHGRPAQGEAA